MDILSFYNISSDVIRNAAENSNTANRMTAEEGFDGILNKAMESLNTTNAYLSDQENEILKWALGETENTHELSIALQKASAALSYTVAVRDRFLEAYREIMQIQI